MTKPKRSRSSRRLTTSRIFLYRMAVLLASLVLEILWWTCRIRYIDLDKLKGLAREHGAVVPVCWHQHLLLCARFLVSDKVLPMKPGFMISPSVDGEAPSMLARFYGAIVVRGSGTYSGLRAVRGAHQALQEGISLAVTPDGPRGPRFKFKPGAIFAAQISGKPVIPVAYAAKPAFVLKTWDKFIIPVPFGKVCMAIGEPYFPPSELSSEQMEQVQRDLETRMRETFKKAQAAL
ncbi:MAG: lysophospholipid acyltransferase family protein [Povalibacter sp.]